jgi:N-dimethylarginine dimethylaminohydrolase
MKDILIGENLVIHTTNEWDPLKRVILGTAKNMNWPFRPGEYSHIPFPPGPIDKKILEESEIALDGFQSVLEDLGVEVLRPVDQDYTKLNGFGAYSTRDCILVVGNKVIFTPTRFKQRRVEWNALRSHIDVDIIQPPITSVHSGELDPIFFDAANVIRCNDDLLYLVSATGNMKGAKWLEKVLPDHNIHPIQNLYSGAHLDSTIVPLREGLVMLNAGRANKTHIPKFMRSWDKIWIQDEDIGEIEEDQHPHNQATKWIMMNALSIDPNTIILNSYQKTIRKKLARYNIEVVPVDLPHTRYLQGGHHCVTLDLLRE